LLAKKYRQLIYSRNHAILSLKEKEIVYEFLKSIPGQSLLSKPLHHRYAWLKCSGAYSQMTSNPNYYQQLIA
jgi:hypothetical protein